MNKTKQKILLFFLFSFSIYCALIIGKSWDEGFHLNQGRIAYNYLLSLGSINEELFYREYYSPIYWTLQYLFTLIFPLEYKIQTTHLVNLFFSFFTIFAIRKLCEELFNKKVGNITFLILFLFPVFFGHMAFNSSDPILAFCHVLIFLLILKYLKKQNIRDKANRYVLFIGVLAAVSTGIQLVFLGSLIPIFLFILADIFFFKKIICNNFIKKKFLYDLLKCFVVFYFLLILFWIDVHPNILILPFNKVIETFTTAYATGVPFNLVNGNYYLSWQVPKFYLFINYFYKTPEYLLISYTVFIFLILKSEKFFEKKFQFFNYKLFLIILILIFPHLLIFVIPYPIYDGMRLFLWTVPYFCVIPGLTIYYLIENLKFIGSKSTLVVLSGFFIYFLINFISITPYQYTYLNMFNGESKNRYKKFENDYWGSSINELLGSAIFEKEKVITMGTCGVNYNTPKQFFKKKGYTNIKFVDLKEADYVIMTNRTTMVSGSLTAESTNESVNLKNCFDRFAGNDIFSVKRNGLILSTIRKIQ